MKPDPIESLRIYSTTWQADATALSLIRRRVFMDEQGVTQADEWDGSDETAVHFIARAASEPIGCARLLPNGKIGRMAVLASFRRQGVGSALLRHVLNYAAQENITSLFLDAQTQALQFYERHGFVAEGEEFQDAGMPHRRMRLAPAKDETASTSPVTRLAGPAECLTALQAQVASGRQYVDILSQHLSPALYADAELVDAISALARRNRHSRVRILVQDTRPLHGTSHALVQLAQRLPSRVALRGLREAPQDAAVGYCAIDRQGLVYFNQEAEMTGFANANARAEVRHLLEEFNHLWEQYSFVDPNLKTLVL